MEGEDRARSGTQRRTELLLWPAAPPRRAASRAQLVLAADQFLILPGSRLEESARAGASGDEVRTVIAGYHWFSDWGRDTMIASPGLTLVHRPASRGARRSCARSRSYVRRRPAAQPLSRRRRDAASTTPSTRRSGSSTRSSAIVDATATIAILVRELYPGARRRSSPGTCAARATASASIPATACSRAGEPGVQLTWMDAKVGDWVVTPRRGKPVEIQALWYNALRADGGLGERARRGRTSAIASWRGRAHAQRSTRASGTTQPAISTTSSTARPATMPSLRPNQIFAVSLPPSHPRPSALARRWSTRCSAQLLTPYGLRTLAPGDPRYRGDYHGRLAARDARLPPGHRLAVAASAPSSTPGCACTRTGARPAAAGAASPHHLRDAGVGSISEIFDAEPPVPTARLHRAGLERRRGAAGVAGDRAPRGTRLASITAESVLRKRVAIGSRVRRGLQRVEYT